MVMLVYQRVFHGKKRGDIISGKFSLKYSVGISLDSTRPLKILDLTSQRDWHDGADMLGQNESFPTGRIFQAGKSHAMIHSDQSLSESFFLLDLWFGTTNLWPTLWIFGGFVLEWNGGDRQCLTKVWAILPASAPVDSDQFWTEPIYLHHKNLHPRTQDSMSFHVSIDFTYRTFCLLDNAANWFSRQGHQKETHWSSADG